MSCSWKPGGGFRQRGGGGGPASREGLAPWPVRLATVREPTRGAGSAPLFQICFLRAALGGGAKGCFLYSALALDHGARLSGGHRESPHPGLLGLVRPTGSTDVLTAAGTSVMFPLAWLSPPVSLNVANLGVGLHKVLGSPALPCGLGAGRAGCVFFSRYIQPLPWQPEDAARLRVSSSHFSGLKINPPCIGLV